MQKSYEGLHHWRGKHGSYEVNHTNDNHGTIDIYLGLDAEDPTKHSAISLQINEENGIWRCKSLTINSLHTKEAKDFALGLITHTDELEAAETVIPVIRELLK